MPAEDPVCGMTVDENAAVATTQFDGQTFFFCSLACRDEFDRDPQAYTH